MLMNFEMKNQGEKREKRIDFFGKVNINDQCILHIDIYNDKKYIYTFIKKCLMKKIMYIPF